MAEPELWAVHIEGPDSILAMASKEEAATRAEGLNKDYETYLAQSGAQAEYIAKWHAVVVPWPYDADGHAAELADIDADGSEW